MHVGDIRRKGEIFLSSCPLPYRHTLIKARLYHQKSYVHFTVLPLELQQCSHSQERLRLWRFSSLSTSKETFFYLVQLMLAFYFYVGNCHFITRLHSYNIVLFHILKALDKLLFALKIHRSLYKSLKRRAP